MTTRYEYLKDYYKYTNWRYVGRSNNAINYKNKGLDSYGFFKKGIWILLDTYRCSCFIYGMNIKEFLQISENGNYHSFRDHFWDVTHMTYCKSCNGAGKLDWISRVTGPQSFDKIRHKYVRDKSKILLFTKNRFLKDCVLAPTKIFKGERMCKDCMGTGIYIDPENINNLLLYDIDNKENLICV